MAELLLNTSTCTTLSTNKSNALWQLSDQLNFKDAEHVEVAVKRFTFTNYFKNIFDDETKLGYVGRVWLSDNPADTYKYELVIPEGSYSVETLNQTLQEQQRHLFSGETVFTLSGNSALNKCYLTFLAAGWYLSQATNTCHELLGFTAGTTTPDDKSSSEHEICVAPNNAHFNVTESIKVRSNLSWGIIDSTNKSNLLAEVVPSTTVGSIHEYQPFNLTFCESLALKSGVSTIQLWIQDQDGVELAMEENWLIELVIRVFSKP